MHLLVILEWVFCQFNNQPNWTADYCNGMIMWLNKMRNIKIQSTLELSELLALELSGSWVLFEKTFLKSALFEVNRWDEFYDS